MRISVRTLVLVLGLQLLLGAVLVVLAVQGFPFLKGATEEDPPARGSAFDGARARADVGAQVALGPRPAGSVASRRLAARLRRQLPEGRLEPAGRGLRNVVGRLPGRPPAVLLAAHYDTKDLPGFVGANDGAAGTAVVIEAARALRHIRRARDAPELRFALFDGEEAPRGAPDSSLSTTGLRGSR